MMSELETERAGAIQLLAINEVGHESGTETMAALGDIPLLQDTMQGDVWASWSAGYRDVVIVDGEGVRVEAYNLTTFDLSNPDNYAALKAKLLAAIDR